MVLGILFQVVCLCSWVFFPPKHDFWHHVSMFFQHPHDDFIKNPLNLTLFISLLIYILLRYTLAYARGNIHWQLVPKLILLAPASNLQITCNTSSSVTPARSMTAESELLLTSTITSTREELDMKHSDNPEWIFLISFYF